MVDIGLKHGGIALVAERLKVVPGIKDGAALLVGDSLQLELLLLRILHRVLDFLFPRGELALNLGQPLGQCLLAFGNPRLLAGSHLGLIDLAGLVDVGERLLLQGGHLVPVPPRHLAGFHDLGPGGYDPAGLFLTTQLLALADVGNQLLLLADLVHAIPAKGGEPCLVLNDFRIFLKRYDCFRLFHGSTPYRYFAESLSSSS